MFPQPVWLKAMLLKLRVLFAAHCPNARILHLGLHGRLVLGGGCAPALNP